MRQSLKLYFAHWNRSRLSSARGPRDLRFRLLFDSRQDLPPAGVHADASGDDAVHRAVRVLDANHGDIRLAKRSRRN